MLSGELISFESWNECYVDILKRLLSERIVKWSPKRGGWVMATDRIVGNHSSGGLLQQTTHENHTAQVNCCWVEVVGAKGFAIAQGKLRETWTLPGWKTTKFPPMIAQETQASTHEAVEELRGRAEQRTRTMDRVWLRGADQTPNSRSKHQQCLQLSFKVSPYRLTQGNRLFLYRLQQGSQS